MGGFLDKLITFIVVVIELLKKIGDYSNSEEVRQALAIAKAGSKASGFYFVWAYPYLVQTGDYHNFFKRHEASPAMGAYIIDHMVTAMRKRAINTMSKAYSSVLLYRLAQSLFRMQKKVPVDYVISELNFTSPKELKEFAKENNFVIKGGFISSTSDK